MMLVFGIGLYTSKKLVTPFELNIGHQNSYKWMYGILKWWNETDLKALSLFFQDYPSIPADVCSLSRDVGPCYEWKSRFYFDAVNHTCTHFWYGGCHGNGNNFVSVDECMKACGDSVRRSVGSRPYRDQAPRRHIRGRSDRARAWEGKKRNEHSQKNPIWKYIHIHKNNHTYHQIRHAP